MKTNWRGVLAPLDTLSSDGRIIATPLIGARFHMDLPLPLHESEVGRVGWINRLWLENGNINGEGTFSDFVELNPLGWCTGGLDLTAGTWEHGADGIDVLRDWLVSGFHIHSVPAFEQTRLEYF